MQWFSDAKQYLTVNETSTFRFEVLHTNPKLLKSLFLILSLNTNNIENVSFTEVMQFIGNKKVNFQLWIYDALIPEQRQKQNLKDLTIYLVDGSNPNEWSANIPNFGANLVNPRVDAGSIIISNPQNKQQSTFHHIKILFHGTEAEKDMYKMYKPWINDKDICFVTKDCLKTIVM